MISFAALRDGDWPMPPDDAIAFVAGMLPDRELRERVRLALEQEFHGRPKVELFDCAQVLLSSGALRFDVKWFQSESEIEVVFDVPEEISSKAIKIVAAPQRITVALFGVTVLDDVTYDAIDKSETSWTIERDLSRGTQLKLSLVKAGRAAWWMSLLNDDTDGRVPECEDRMNPDLAYSIASHLEGQGDVRLAFKYYKAAADGRHALSASWVGNLYIDGNADAGIPADTEKALQYLTIAAEEGNIEAMYQIGHAFHYGVGSPPDFDRAAFWYKMAAERGNHMRSMYQLGHLYHRFDGRVSDHGAAASWWERAASFGFPDACFNLGLYYLNGVGVQSVDVGRAIDLLSKAVAAQPSFNELLVHNGIDLEALSAEHQAARAERRRARRRRRTRSAAMSWVPWVVTGFGMAVVAAISWKWSKAKAASNQIRQRP
ncbi:CS domain-containing protein [Plasmodiophora brassicae]|uniref:CS domain-containing protein n=1 Tax=Plasmodiophora brassicae TaxID=37360 RepID=A0A0G4J742_PLABS|nr:hypothetical protein PBRA_003160 [Plasmodiophora brassicae]SPQ95635.1 unnamed protein product [Plasmodiophora brassicae]